MVVTDHSDGAHKCTMVVPALFILPQLKANTDMHSSVTLINGCVQFRDIADVKAFLSGVYISMWPHVNNVSASGWLVRGRCEDSPHFVSSHDFHKFTLMRHSRSMRLVCVFHNHSEVCCCMHTINTQLLRRMWQIIVQLPYFSTTTTHESSVNLQCVNTSSLCVLQSQEKLSVARYLSIQNY